VFFSPHKFIGGPQTPGVLVVRRDLAGNRVPTVPGGGTVAFVDPVGHRYLDDPVAREEGGTPGIVESVRAGLVVALKQAVGTDLIREREERFLRRALDRWRRNPNLELLGNLEAARLPIVSFRVRHGDRHLHHELVVAMLNDLFGIQARGGCSCAGPYGHRLLGDYRFDPHSGQWRHRLAPPDPVPPLSELLDGRAGPGPWPGAGEDALAGYLRQARALLGAAGPFTTEVGAELAATRARAAARLPPARRRRQLTAPATTTARATARPTLPVSRSTWRQLAPAAKPSRTWATAQRVAAAPVQAAKTR
jgi:hypothetical protein